MVRLVFRRNVLPPEFLLTLPFSGVVHHLSGANTYCDFLGRKINFTNSKTLVGWCMSRPTVTRVTFDLSECKEPLKTKNEKKRKSRKTTRKKKIKGNEVKKSSKKHFLKSNQKIKTLNRKGRTPPFRRLTSLKPLSRSRSVAGVHIQAFIYIALASLTPGNLHTC